MRLSRKHRMKKNATLVAQAHRAPDARETVSNHAKDMILPPGDAKKQRRPQSRGANTDEQRHSAASPHWSEPLGPPSRRSARELERNRSDGLTRSRYDRAVAGAPPTSGRRCCGGPAGPDDDDGGGRRGGSAPAHDAGLARHGSRGEVGACARDGLGGLA